MRTSASIACFPSYHEVVAAADPASPGGWIVPEGAFFHLFFFDKKIVSRFQEPRRFFFVLFLEEGRRRVEVVVDRRDEGTEDAKFLLSRELLLEFPGEGVRRLDRIERPYYRDAGNQHEQARGYGEELGGETVVPEEPDKRNKGEDEERREAGDEIDP